MSRLFSISEVQKYAQARREGKDFVILDNGKIISISTKTLEQIIEIGKGFQEMHKGCTYRDAETELIEDKCKQITESICLK